MFGFSTPTDDEDSPPSGFATFMGTSPKLAIRRGVRERERYNANEGDRKCICEKEK